MALTLSNTLNWGGAVTAIGTLITQAADCPAFDPKTTAILTTVAILISALGGQKNKKPLKVSQEKRVDEK